ncbi:MAG: hypothetical protein PF637_08840 [Spirochaetes bacterium]|jgi:hypothetical protein|nr:hypothetical protein [Spirochaetota bacterium]
MNIIKKYLVYAATLLLAVFIISFNTAAQEAEPAKKKVGLSIGFLDGSSLLGAEIEYMVFPHIAPTIGGGFKGYNAGMNLHLRDHVNSSYLGLTYGHAGFNNDESISYAEISLNFRFLWILEFSIGSALPLSTGKDFEQDFNDLTRDIEQEAREVDSPFITYNLSFYWTF